MESFCSIYQQKCIQLQIQPIKAILALFENAGKRGVNINHIDLSYKSLDSRAVIPIAAALGFNITINNINLGYNLIDKRGCKAISHALRTNSSLTTLDLCGNKIGDEGVKYLAEALTENATLCTLLLRSNNIHDAGVCDLASALTGNSSLRELDLGQNVIQVTGGESLATALTHNTTLERLGLSNTNMPQGAIHSISLCIGKGGLKYLDVRGNNVDSAILSRLNVANTNSNHSSSFVEKVHTPRGGDKNVEDHLTSLANSLRHEMSLLDDENEGEEGKKMSLRLESLTQTIEDQLGGRVKNNSSSYMSSLLATDDFPKKTYSPTPKQDTTTTVDTLRQLNNNYGSQITKLQHQLKVANETHKRKVNGISFSVANSEQNMREIIVEMKESMNRMERELIEKSKKTVAVEHELERLNYARDQDMKVIQTRNGERIREIRSKAQSQYDQLCLDYQDYQQRSRVEFLALFNDFETSKKQVGTLQQQNLRLTTTLEEHKQLVNQLQSQVDELTLTSQHAITLQQQLTAADSELLTLQETVRTKDEELTALRVDNDKLAYWLKSMQKAVVDVNRAEVKGREREKLTKPQQNGVLHGPIPTSPPASPTKIPLTSPNSSSAAATTAIRVSAREK